MKNPMCGCGWGTIIIGILLPSLRETCFHFQYCSVSSVWEQWIKHLWKAHCRNVVLCILFNQEGRRLCRCTHFGWLPVRNGGTTSSLLLQEGRHMWALKNEPWHLLHDQRGSCLISLGQRCKTGLMKHSALAWFRWINELTSQVLNPPFALIFSGSLVISQYVQELEVHCRQQNA